MVFKVYLKNFKNKNQKNVFPNFEWENEIIIIYDRRKMKNDCSLKTLSGSLTLRNITLDLKSVTAINIRFTMGIQIF